MSDHHTNKDEEEQDVDDNHLSTNVPAHRLCSPYPFGRYHCSHRYISGSVLDIPESGTLNFIEPCHEFKAFIDTPDEKKQSKFIIETIRFAAGCMNSRTNGTIHFGIRDKPHGQVFGVAVEDKEVYGNQLQQEIDRYFEKPKDARICIKVPRFVEVLNSNDTSSNKYVIEVDIVPDSATCQEHLYFTTQASELNVKSKHKPYFYVRDGSSTKNINTDTYKSPKDLNGKNISEATHKRLVAIVTQNSQLRKRQEEMQLSAFKSSTQGLRLSQFITGGRLSLDESDLKYVVVTNKSHSSQLARFLAELKPIAILDFDPESAERGLEHYCQAQMTVNPHLSRQYVSEEIADQLKSTQKTNWIFCNGGISNETPSDIQQWSKEKGDCVQHLISVLCQKDVSQNKRLRIVFLLLSPVSEAIDPLVYAFHAFRQELGDTSQFLCICDNENAFISWRDLVKAQCEIDISHRCIHQLSFAEVSGTVLSLSSGNRKTERFLPCGGGSKVLLEKSVERDLCTLEVLCENQCEGENENKMALEKNFYRGGKVSWQNFYYLEKHESSVLIKREHLRVIIDSILNVRSHPDPCVLFNLKHEPGCGGTTLARHVLWGNRTLFRCAVLKDRNADSSDVADHVVQLLTYGHEEQLSVPVFLMLDDFDDFRKVSDLQQHIQSKCKKNIKTTQVVILNCFRSDLSELSEINEQTFYIKNKLSAKEQTLFEKTLPKVKQRPRNAETFYTFMSMKKKLMPEYFQAVVRNTLRNFSIAQQQSKLFAALTHLTVMSQNASLPVSVCEEFLGPDLIPIHGTDRLQGLWGIFANLIWPVTDKNDGPVNVKMIHPLIAKYCLEELTTTHKITIAEMTNAQSELAGLFDSPGGDTFSHWLSKLFRKLNNSCSV